jgi:hypothetical protein
MAEQKLSGVEWAVFCAEARGDDPRGKLDFINVVNSVTPTGRRLRTILPLRLSLGRSEQHS